ncbi:MAG: STAS domain-containing protein, partial [bacterium]
MIVAYNGSVTERTSIPMPGFDKAIERHCAGVVLDLSGVEYINSVGVSSFMDTFKYLRDKGLNVALCSPIPPVFKVLKLARTELIVPVTKTRSEAKQLLHSFPGQKTHHQRENILLIMGKVNIKEGLVKVLKETGQEVNYNIVTALSPARAWKILGG